MSKQERSEALYHLLNKWKKKGKLVEIYYDEICLKMKETNNIVLHPKLLPKKCLNFLLFEKKNLNFEKHIFLPGESFLKFATKLIFTF